MNGELIAEAAEQMTHLPYRMQERVLLFIKELISSGKRGRPGKRLLKYAEAIPPDDLQTMSEVIERDCGQINADEW
ncbi:MAG: hypothetical protein ACL93V_00315 [Candidatus Electrothrix sp. YB6]